MTTPNADPTRHGAGGIGSFTVLYDAYCPLCRAARRWLESRAQVVPLVFVPAGSTAARQHFAGLDHDATLRDITVVADTGEVYVGDGAWLACLWALADYRALADRLAQPHLLPVARRVVRVAAAARERSAARDGRRGFAAPDSPAAAGQHTGYRGDDDRADCTDDRCG
jgi:predicted DCC family thiol-disulfide oxidoreductase YuxK